jgi:hypothetical protein
MDITPSWFGGLNFCHSTGVISFSYQPFPSTRLAGGFLFRTFRPQLAKALIKTCLSAGLGGRKTLFQPQN